MQTPAVGRRRFLQVVTGFLLAPFARPAASPLFVGQGSSRSIFENWYYDRAGAPILQRKLMARVRITEEAIAGASSGVFGQWMQDDLAGVVRDAKKRHEGMLAGTEPAWGDDGFD